MSQRFVVTIAFVSALIAASVDASTITVNTTDDTTSNSDGKCTFREALTAANTNMISGGVAGECAAGAMGLDTIEFAIAGSGVKTITLPFGVALPAITEAVTINGYTQSGSSPNTNALADGINAVPLIELSGLSSRLIVQGSGTTIRGLIIHGGGDLIQVEASNVTIAGNFIGTDATGLIAMPTGGGGFGVRQKSGDNVTYGGPNAADRNLISGNAQGGIIVENGDGTTVQGNYVGPDKTGMVSLDGPNNGVGVDIIGGGPFNTSNSEIIGNLVSGNNGGGLDVSGTGGFVIQGNLIGTQRDGVSDLGNGQSGINVRGSTTNVQIGGVGAGQPNVIAFTEFAGIAVNLNAEGISILRNSIHSNGALGISLSPSSPANPIAQDNCDTNDDVAGNDGQNHPVITSAMLSGGMVTISGTLNSKVSTMYRLEFFSNASCDTSKKGEGQTFLGATDVTTGAGSCDVNFGPLMFAVPPGQPFFTATATDPSGNTSEFSSCQPQPGATPTPTATVTVTASPSPGPVTATPTLTASRTPTPTGTLTATRTPTPTTTASPGTPTATATVAPGTLRSFECYSIAREKVAAIPGVTMADEFGQNGSANLRRPTRLCAPADRASTDPSAPQAPGHLLGYELQKRAPRFLKVKHVKVTPASAFPEIDVDVIRPVLLFTPTRKSTTSDPGAADGLGLNHFQCYLVKGAKTRADDVHVADQFGELTEDVKRPFRLCVPVSKNGEGIANGSQALMCYVIRPARRPRFTGRAPLFVHDQFGPRTIGIKRPTELCVPATVTRP